MNRFDQYLLLTIAAGLLFGSTMVAAQDPVDFSESGELSDPLLDPVNKDVRINSIYAIFMRLELSDDVATANGLEMQRIPVSQAEFGEDPQKIILYAFDPNGVLVGRTSVADRQMIARDGQALILRRRNVSVIVPLIARPEHIEIHIPNNPAPINVDGVADVVGDFCDTFATDPFCTGEPPDSSPFFDLLRRPDP